MGGTVEQESLAKIQQIVNAAAETLRIEIVDAKHQSGILMEAFRHEVQLVAEGFRMHLGRHHTDDRVYMDEQFRETRVVAFQRRLRDECA